MSDVAIRVEGLGKQYRLGESQESYSTLRDQFRKWTSLRGLLRRANRAEHNPPFWALKDVSFEVKQGEVIGIIGRNGAGKSTLLKILSRITEPTEGGADIHGRVGSLLEVGTGFHPELTGRENVYLNGAIMGMKRAEIVRKFDEIVAFAEVEKFIDTPVKHYSSGMYMRLAFAVAAHLDPEILIVDEVLAVGDAEFQKKCLGKMSEVSQGGRTVLFVSHNLAAIEVLCTKLCMLNQGHLMFDGPVKQGVSKYLDQNNTKITNLKFNNETFSPLYFSEVVDQLVGEQPNLNLIVSLKLQSRGNHSPAFLAIDIIDEAGITIMQALPSALLISDRAEHSISVDIELPPLVPGRYSATLWVGPHNTATYDHIESAIWFEIITSPSEGRTFPHTRDHGWIVPKSRITNFY